MDELNEEELRDIKREIIESRGLIIKTNNLTNALAADLKSIGKRQEEQLIVIYKEIVAQTQGYAAANGYHAVMAYGDPTDQNDLFNVMNIDRKLKVAKLLRLQHGSTNFEGLAFRVCTFRPVADCYSVQTLTIWPVLGGLLIFVQDRESE